MKSGLFVKTTTGCLLALVAVAALGAASSPAAGRYVFDPQLSLTGGCTTSADDLLPDPSCPYLPPPDGPGESFILPTGLAIDSYGDVYVAVGGREGQDEAHIDIFNAQSEFISELPRATEPSLTEPPRLARPRTVAVDSKGYLYVYALSLAANRLLRYDPFVYDPLSGEITYETPPAVIAQGHGDYAALAINPENDHLFANFGVGSPGNAAIQEFGSGEEGNPLLDSDVAKVCCFDGPGLAIDASRGRLYATDQPTGNIANEDPRLIRVFELAAPHNLIETIDGSSTPDGSFVVINALSLAVDESTGNLFAYPQEQRLVIWELTSEGQYLSTIEHNFLSKEWKNQVAIDNGENSPHGELNPDGRYLWATSAPPGTIGHAYAFEPRTVCAPEVAFVSFSDVSEDEALLQGSVNPCKADTSYRFEYVSKQQFEEHGFESAPIASQGTIPAGKLPVDVSGEATGLSPGTRYVFRIVATNEVESVEKLGEFKTYPEIAKLPCPNDEFRTGPSAALPDCRAYELVTPPDTGGRLPTGLGTAAVSFPTLPASPDGIRVSFRIESGLIPGPGSEGSGSLAGDPYLASRGPGGWGTIATGGTATQATVIAPGGRSPDQTYSAWAAEGQGPAVIGGEATFYIRYPDGHSELAGRGSLADDPHAEPRLISENAAHILFVSRAHLEENSPSPGKLAVYDRTAGGITHLVSLLPGGVPPAESQEVKYKGSSLDGKGVAFTVEQAGITTLYLRYNNQETYKVGDGVTFAGVAEGGRRIFYLEGGKLFAFDVEGGVIQFAPSSDVTVVNVSADGTTAYFVSPTKLPSLPNPLGKKAVSLKNNLYQSREGTLRFVGIVSSEDVTGEISVFNGLGLWTNAVGGTGGGGAGAFAIDPSRTTDDGTVLLFQSNADLTNNAPLGYRQIYRYDSAADELACLSCNPTGAPATGGASLQSHGLTPPNNRYDLVQNLSADGRRAFFESLEPLVAADTDGLQDVYEWEAQGVGSCSAPEGCVYLISFGRSEEVNYLYAASDSGDDVFFRTSDLLRPFDADTTPSFYDARLGGGFPEAVSHECEGEGCHPQLTQPPVLPTPGMTPGASGNVRKCPKGKRKVRRHGKVRCVKKKHRRDRHRASANAKGAGI